MIQYGLISRVDAGVIEKTLDLIIEGHDSDLHITEIGVFDGQTARGIREYVLSKNRGFCYTAIDNNKDKEVLRPFESCNMIIGNSNEVYHRLDDNSQDFIFVDGCHCFAHVISDFFCYAPKVKVGGYFAFHDTGKHIKPFKDFQHGDKENPDAYISVRKALRSIGLLLEDLTETTILYAENILENWELIFDEADETNEAGGICVFKKLY